jgi:hypothetical protein
MSILFCAMTHYFTPIDYNEFGDDPKINTNELSD